MTTQIMTFKDATTRTLATLVQAASAWLLLVAGAFVTGTLTAQWAITSAVATVAVPVITAVQRFAQAWQNRANGDVPPA